MLVDFKLVDIRWCEEFLMLIIVKMPGHYSPLIKPVTPIYIFYRIIEFNSIDHMTNEYLFCVLCNSTIYIFRSDQKIF